VSPRSRFYPFCCERCKLIDLGAWLDGKYVIPGEPVTPSMEREGEEEKDGGSG
ncbi:MAG: DNA gyrase inhibitor YacG, partial [Gemmatimonadales bacterium]|nr:DNA gyrase inhibitor YacG [Gemmatimonadales bacterium]